MKKGDFLYRQKQRLKYHLAKNEVEKQIAEINRHAERIRVKEASYLIGDLSFELPKNQFDFVFSEFEYFVDNAVRLNGKYKIENGQLVFSWDHLKANISSASELYLIHEIYVNLCYNFMIPGDAHVKVIDIGMNVGMASLFFAGLPFVDAIFSYEPFRPTYELAMANYSLNPGLSGKIHPENYGLGNKHEVVSVPFLASNLGRNTSFTADRGDMNTAPVEQITLKPAGREIQDLLRKYPEDPFVLKIDTEGAEYDILESISATGLPEQIVVIMMEWHHRGPGELEHILLREGFHLVSIRDHKKTGLIYGFRKT